MSADDTGAVARAWGGPHKLTVLIGQAVAIVANDYCRLSMFAFGDVFAVLAATTTCRKMVRIHTGAWHQADRLVTANSPIDCRSTYLTEGVEIDWTATKYCRFAHRWLTPLPPGDC